jgi:hypothetical protein
VLIVTEDWPGFQNGGFLSWRKQHSADQTGPNNRAFHLGEFVQVLLDTSWLGFDFKLTKAHRTEPHGQIDEVLLKADRGCDVVGFRFDQPFLVEGKIKTLADYDLILFFPINPSAVDSAESLQNEAEAISLFMENGGGFFATGDHENLGAPLAQLIPRVRSMRRWFFDENSHDSPSQPGPNGEPPAPSALGPDRHDTLQPNPDLSSYAFQFEDQSDEIAQPINPTLFGRLPGPGLGTAQGYPAVFRWPHPLLCSPDGLVSYLPDHIHEGWCEVPGDLTKTFSIAGSSLDEYPLLGTDRLAPDVVATGTVIGGHTTPSLLTNDTPSTHQTIAATFGVICAWDGHRVGRGRVVVDSTWHHFFNINLTGDLSLIPSQGFWDQRVRGFLVDDGNGNPVPNDTYKRIQWYYRNIVYWLIPANRKAGIWWRSLIELSQMSRFGEELTASRIKKLLPPDHGAHSPDRKFEYTLGGFVKWCISGSWLKHI